MVIILVCFGNQLLPYHAQTLLERPPNGTMKMGSCRSLSHKARQKSKIKIVALAVKRLSEREAKPMSKPWETLAGQTSL